MIFHFNTFLFLTSSVSKEWSLPDLGRLTIYGAPFKDIVVPLLVVVDILPHCPAAINRESRLFASGTYSTFCICNDTVLFGMMLYPITVL